jgi:hypothetical protein
MGHDMSDTSQGSGWWMASDGKWYPPELWTGPPNQAPAGPAAQTSPPASPGQPASPQQPAYPAQSAYPAQPVPAQPTYPPQGPPAAGAAPYGGSVPPGYTGYGTASPYAPYGQPAAQKTNGLAIAALVCGIGGFLFLIPAILGIIFGFIARSQIRNSNGQQKGSGMALAGIIVGFAWVAILVLEITLSVALSNNDNNSGVVGPAILMGQLHLGALFT